MSVTRDSNILKILLLVSVVLGVLATITDPTLYGLDPVRGAVVMNWIKLVSLVVTAITGYLQTSPLKGEHDSKKVKRRRGNMGAWLLPFLLTGSLVGGSVGASSCSLAKASVAPKPAVSEQQAARNEGAKLARATKEFLDLAVEARRRAQAFYDVGSLSADKMIAINEAAGNLGGKALDFIDFGEKGTTNASLKTSAAALYKLFDDYINAINLGGWSGEAMRAALAAFRAYLGVK